VSTQLNNFIKILEEMFQFDQLELDFGIYRIMNQKREEVNHFLKKDLIPQVKQAFEKYKDADIETIKVGILKLEKQLADMGVSKESSEKYNTFQSRLNQGIDVVSLENEVLSDLTNFFKRYYHEGDFLSLRRYKKDVYSIPYEGEEVKLHWANADQYYVKSSEYFQDYTFTLPSGKKVHFKLVEASTEQNNNKAQEGKERRFILVDENPLIVKNNELFIRFEYRSDNEKRTRERNNIETIERILEGVDYTNWIEELQTLMPAEKRTFLEKHLNDYTAKNSFDYFIHKNLGGFLRRELDFFIKNEILHLDDLDTEDEKRFEQYLSKVKVIKSIGTKIINFLEQIENFQKKLWLKKKFVVESNYCITLDRIPEELYNEIIVNKEQINEWGKLFYIHEIIEDITTIGFNEELSIDFLKQNQYLLLDTKFFQNEFKLKLLSSIDDLDAELNGLLIHGENFQALNLIQNRYRESIQCCYIDPPYNTGKNDFIYKDSYRHSSWLSMLDSRISLLTSLLKPSGVNLISIGNHELPRLTMLMETKYGEDNLLNTFIWNTDGNIDNQSKFKQNHEYIVSFSMNEKLLAAPTVIDPNIPKESKLYNEFISNTIVKNGPGNPMSNILLPKGFPAGFNEGMIIPGKEEYPRFTESVVVKEGRMTAPLTINSGWSSKDLIEKFIDNKFKPIFDSKGQKTWFEIRESGAPYVIKERMNSGHVLTVLQNMGSTQSSSSILKHMNINFTYPKPVPLIQHLIAAMAKENDTIIDFFAGSGTTGHAVLNLNREDSGNRKYILVEMGEHFNTVLKKRIQKVIYSKDWKDGKPVSREGSSHMFKYIRLESYEDALNNIDLHLSEQQKLAIVEHMTPEAKEKYLLSYMLDVETEGSVSLLNIDMFKNPFDYKMKINGGTETKIQKIDLVETFNYLLGLHVKEMEIIKGFQLVKGQLSTGEDVLVIWRNLMQSTNEDLEEFLMTLGINSRDFEYDRIYVNGDNHIENLKIDESNWKVVLIEEEFKRLMFDVQDV